MTAVNVEERRKRKRERERKKLISNCFSIIDDDNARGRRLFDLFSLLSHHCRELSVRNSFTLIV